MRDLITIVETAQQPVPLFIKWRTDLAAAGYNSAEDTVKLSFMELANIIGRHGAIKLAAKMQERGVSDMWSEDIVSLHLTAGMEDKLRSLGKSKIASLPHNLSELYELTDFNLYYMNRLLDALKTAKVKVFDDLKTLPLAERPIQIIETHPEMMYLQANNFIAAGIRTIGDLIDYFSEKPLRKIPGVGPSGTESAKRLLQLYYERNYS